MDFTQFELACSPRYFQKFLIRKQTDDGTDEWMENFIREREDKLYRMEQRVARHEHFGGLPSQEIDYYRACIDMVSLELHFLKG